MFPLHCVPDVTVPPGAEQPAPPVPAQVLVIPVTARTFPSMLFRNPWPGRGWPFTAAEERELVECFAKAEERPAEYEHDEPPPEEIVPGVTRLDVTLLVTILRQGSHLHDILSVAPGVNLPGLARAYELLERLRLESFNAFERLCHRPDEATIEQTEALASRIAPVPVRRIVTAIRASEPEEVIRCVHRERAEVERSWQVADALRVRITITDERETRLGLMEALSHPEDESVLLHPGFVARCVSELSPVRVSSLLGEQRPVAPT